MKIIILTYLLISLISPTLSAQCEVNKLTSLLYSSDVHDRINAAQRIADCNLEELIPLLEERYYDENYLYAAHRILFALAKLDAENLEKITLDFIGNVDNLTLITPDDPLGSKVYATQILFNLNNYSTIDYIFQIVDRDRPEFNPLTIFLLIEFLSNNELIRYRNYAKTELENYLNTDEDYVTRSLVLDHLAASYGSRIVDLILDKAYNEQEWILRSTALKSLLNINYENSRSVFYERLQDDPNRDVRWEIADSVLCHWGEPQDLKKILNYYPNEPDPVVKKDMQYYSTRVFIPPKPEGLSYNDLFFRLISYTDELFQYGWIENEETRDYYIQKLNAVKESIENNNATAEACTIINEQLLPKAEQDLKGELITTEGYKFLHYYTIYIKEEIEKEFGSCQ